jgi:hypothetical protein
MKRSGRAITAPGMTNISSIRTEAAMSKRFRVEGG